VALAALDRFMAALDGGDEPALLATPHFPHYRLAAGKMRMWDQPGAYLGDFFARAGRNWHHSGWDFRKVIAPAPPRCTWTCNSPAIAPTTRWSAPFACIFRGKSATDSGMKSATDSDLISAIPI